MISIRVLWPWVRILGAHRHAQSLLAALGIELAQLGDRDHRLPCRAAMGALELAVALFDDPALGLKAGCEVEHGDLDVLEYAARATANVGEAIAVMSRYLRIMNESAEIGVVVEGDTAYWRYVPTIEYHPAGIDFAIASALAFTRRNMLGYVPPAEIWVTHGERGYAQLYEELLQAPVRFEAPHTGLVMHRAALGVPMQLANPFAAEVFDAQAQRMLSSLQGEGTVGERVRKQLTTQLATGSASMEHTARSLGMGVATLRRKLEDEGTSFKAILESLRETASQRYLQDTSTTVSEVAFLLGFSDVRAFGRAFKRWTGLSPTDYRARHDR